MESAGAAVAEVVHAELARLAEARRAARAARSSDRRWWWCCAARATTAATGSWSRAGWRPRPAPCWPSWSPMPSSPAGPRGHNWNVLQAMASAGSLELFVAPTPELLLRLRERIAEAHGHRRCAARIRRLRPAARADLDGRRPRQRHAHPCTCRPAARLVVAVDTPTRIDLTGGARSTPVVDRRRDRHLPPRQGRIRARPRGATTGRPLPRGADRHPARGRGGDRASRRRVPAGAASPRSPGRSRSSVPTRPIGRVAGSPRDPAAPD